MNSLVADRPSDPPLGVVCLHLPLKTQLRVQMKCQMLDENWVEWVCIRARAFARPYHESLKGQFGSSSAID